jgi:hypothetical protein
LFFSVWGVIWLIQAFIFFALGVIVGLVAFKKSAAEQEAAAEHFLPVPGSSGALSIAPSTFLVSTVFVLVTWIAS